MNKCSIFFLLLLVDIDLKSQMSLFYDVQLRTEVGVTVNEKYVGMPGYKFFGTGTSGNDHTESYSRNAESESVNIAPSFGLSAIFKTEKIVMPYVNISYVQMKGTYNYVYSEKEAPYTSSPNDTIFFSHSPVATGNYKCDTRFSFFNYNGGAEFKIYKGLRLGIGAGFAFRTKSTQIYNGTKNYEVTNTGTWYSPTNGTDGTYVSRSYYSEKVTDLSKTNASPLELTMLMAKILYQYKVERCSFGVHFTGAYSLFARAPYLSAGINFSFFTVNDSED